MVFYLSLNKIILAVQILVSKEGNIIAKSKIFIALVIVLSLVVCSCSLMAQGRKNAEVGLGAAGVTYWEDSWTVLGGVIGFGYNAIIGFELGGIISIGEGGGVILSANLVMSPFNLQRVMPYAIGGVWTAAPEGSGWNIGGGLKIKLNENLAIRAEYRRLVLFEESEVGATSISGGLSLFF